jgi:hypothetical protein
MKQHYFVVRWDKENGWQLDNAVADAVLDGTIWDNDKEEWQICDDTTEEQDGECSAELTRLLKGEKQ